jgi:hypothetical protein
MSDLVSSTIKLINGILQRYHCFHTLQEEAQQFRHILRSSRSILDDLKHHFESCYPYNYYPYRYLEDQNLPRATIMNELQSAITMGGKVLEKCVVNPTTSTPAQQPQPPQFQRFLLTQKYVEIISTAANTIQASLSKILSAVDRKVPDHIMGGDIREEVDYVRQKTRRCNELLFVTIAVASHYGKSCKDVAAAAHKQILFRNYTAVAANKPILFRNDTAAAAAYKQNLCRNHSWTS